MALKDEIRQLLVRNASPQSVERVDAEFEALCVELVSEWLTGNARYESMSQQTEHWLSRVYETIYADEQPEATRIYQRFRFPLPRAQYLARLLIARSAGQWRSLARGELKDTLKAMEASARVAAGPDDNDPKPEGATQRYDLSLSRGAYDELIVLYDDLCRTLPSASRPAAPRKLPASSAYVVWFSITANALLAILKLL